MGFLDRLLGRTPPTEQHQQRAGWDDGRGLRSAATPARPPASEEERAVARYRYLLRTAPPEQLEAMHAEAFATLTPQQREQLLRELATAAPGEAGTSAEPADLARAATRAEMRQPGTLQSTFSRGSFGGGIGTGSMGMGGMMAGSMMGTIAGVVIGSAVANMLFDDYGSSPEAQDAGDTGGESGGAGDSGDSGSDTGDGGSGDAGGDASAAADTSGTDSGGDWGGGGGGGDWGGGGDFGGGDFGGF